MKLDIDLTEINKIVDEFMYQYMSAIVNSGHSATGNLGLKQKKRIRYNDRSFEVYLQLEPYWKHLENGTKPHFPPISAIIKWIEVKPIIPTAKNGKLPTTKQLAYAIANKISKVGTKPTHLLEQTKTKFKLEDQLTQALTDAITTKLNELLESIWNGKI